MEFSALSISTHPAISHPPILLQADSPTHIRCITQHTPLPSSLQPQPHSHPAAMFRVALKSISRSAIPKTAPVAARQSLIQPTGLARSSAVVAQRTYASGGGLSRSEIESRVLDILKSFEKVNGGKVSDPDRLGNSCLYIPTIDAIAGG